MQSEAASLSTDEKEGMIELRQELDAMLEWQADDTPEHILNSPLTFVGAAVPPRPGSLKDFLLARRTKAEEEAATSATGMNMEGVVEGVAEARTKAEIDESAEARGEVEGMEAGTKTKTASTLLKIQRLSEKQSGRFLAKMSTLSA